MRWRERGRKGHDELEWVSVDRAPRRIVSDHTWKRRVVEKAAPNVKLGRLAA